MSKIHPAGTVLNRFCLHVHLCGCGFFVINLFDKNINDFVTFGTQIFELRVDTEVKVYRGTFQKDTCILFWIYVKYRYKNFSFHISIVQLL